MKAALEKLSAVGTELYAEAAKAAQAAGAAGAAGGATPDAGAAAGGASAGGAKKTEKKADVVDADFEVVDEDKKK
jgi:molecular chaperone DnaK